MKLSIGVAGYTLAQLLLGTAATAQTAPPVSEPTDTSASGLQDIVVTAQRRSENLQHAAIAVTAVSGDALAAAGVTRPTELTSLVPSLQVVPSSGPYNLFYLRGVGNFQGNALSESAIAFTFDNVYIGRPSGTTGFFYDLERVEVVKGPQGTLYGRNATGGAINVISKRPRLGEFGASGSVEFGNYDALRLDGAVNVPIGKQAALRLAGIRVRHDGYMDDGTDDQDDWGVRASLRAEPSSTLSVDIVGDYFDQGGRGVGSTPLVAPLGVANAGTVDVDARVGFFSPAGQSIYTAQRANTLQRNFQPFPADFQPFSNNRTYGIAATANWTSSLGTLTLIPGYRKTKLDYLSFSPGFQIRERSNSEQKTFEGRFATNEQQPLRALIGYFHFDEKSRSPATSYVSNWNGQYDRDLRASTNSDAVFGRLTYAVTPDIRLTAGARKTWEKKTFSDNRLSYTLICQGSPAACVNAPSLPYGTTPPVQTFTAPITFNPTVLQVVLPVTPNARNSFNKFTWRLGADWDVTPRNLLYASFETGFKAGGFYASPGAGTYAPETIKAFTIGSKNRFFDNRVQINLEAFYWRYRNQQISHLVNILGVPTFATENVGRASFKGVEVDARFAATTTTTTLTADVQYLDAVYSSFVYTQSNASGIANTAIFNGSACPTVGFDAATNNSFRVDCSGRRPANAPKWTVNLGGQQRVPARFGEFVLDARAHYQSQTLVGLEFLPIEYQKDYWLVDGALTFNAPNRKYYVGGFVNNIFDVTVKSQNFPTPGTNIYATTLRPPRTYGVRAGFNF